MVAVGAGLGTDAYVCVMKCKQAELDAIDSVPTDRFVPLLEVADATRGAAIARKWPPGEAIWIQPVNVAGMDDQSFGQAIEDLFDLLRDHGVTAVPTVVLDDTPETAAALLAVLQADGHGLVLRLDAEELVVTASGDVRQNIDGFLNFYGVSPGSCDLVLDVSLVRDGVAARVATAETAMSVVPYLTDWRNFVVAFSAFPDQVGAQMGKDTVHDFSRADRRTYLSLLSRGVARTPVYADFGVGLPTYADVAFSPIPNIKYTDVSEWHVHRGKERTNPSPQYVSLAQAVAAAPYFRGAGFSSGDNYLAAVATGGDGPGNATTYLRAAMSHHIHHVLDRLATHGEP